MEFSIEPIPVWAMCYLVNGDTDSITDKDKAIVDEISATILLNDFLQSRLYNETNIPSK